MTRARINLNREWSFLRADAPGAQRIDFDDSTWQPIGLPHTFDLPYFRTPEFYVGYGWYRKVFDLPAVGKRVFLEFDGVFQVAEVFVNGRRVGQHDGGYTGFCFDITDFVNPGSNVLAVRVNNHWNPRLQPRAGEHIFSGGIYRDAYLVVTDPLHVTWCGTFATTPQVSRESGTVRVHTEVRNDSTESKRCSLLTRIFDPDGRIVAEMQSKHSIAAHATVEFEQASSPIEHPKLWHPDHPHLYTVRTQVYDDATLVDEHESPLGFRWFDWTADRGFFLNGEHIYLRGANVHQDHSGWGIGISQAACRRDVKLMKDCGFNFIRGAHYPHHPAFARACDELGMIFWSENCFWGKGGFGPEGYWNASAYPIDPDDFEPFEQSCKQQIAEMIRINRNHPSIVIWSMTNEAFFTYNLDRARNLISQLVALSRQADPTRPAAIGGAQRGDVDKLGDVAGYNGDGARLFINPGVPNLVSEYGAISKPHDVYEPFFHELQAEQFLWRSGQAIWCGFDYGTIAGKQGLKGIVDHARLPKRSWYWYRNEYLKVPPPQVPASGVPRRLRLSADKLTITGTDATDDCQLIVTVCDESGNHINNCPTVTLTIESGPGEFPTGPSITFDPGTDIGIVNGQAAVAFRSYHGAQTVIRATSPGLDGATIVITTEGEPAFRETHGRLSDHAAARPYVPPRTSEAALRAMNNAVNVALNRPSRTSSEHDAHPARLANDGNPNTFWRGLEGPGDAWWQVDLEGFYQLSAIRITFAAEDNHRFTIQTSQDGQQWALAADRTQSMRTDRVRNDVFPPSTVARFVRLTFTHSGQPALAEVDLQGVLSVQ